MQPPVTNDYPLSTNTNTTNPAASASNINNINNSNNNNNINNNTPSPSTYPSCPNPSTTPTTTPTPSSPQSQRQSQLQPQSLSLSHAQPNTSPQPLGEYQCHHADCLRRFARKTSLTNHLKAHNNHRSRSIYRTKRARMRAAAALQAAVASAAPSSSSPKKRSIISKRPISLPTPARPSSSPTTSSDPPISHTLPPRPPSSPPAHLSYPHPYFSAPQPPTHINHSQSYPLLYSTQPHSNAYHSFQAQPPSSYPLHSSAPSIVSASHSMQTQPVPHHLSVENAQNHPISSSIGLMNNAPNSSNMYMPMHDPTFNIHHNFTTDRSEEPLVSPSGWPAFPSPIASAGAELSLSLLSPRSFGHEQPTSLTALELLLAPEGTPFPPTNAQFASPINAVPASSLINNVDLPWPISTTNHNALHTLPAAYSQANSHLFMHDEIAANRPTVDSGMLSSVTPPTPGDANAPCLESGDGQDRLNLFPIHPNHDSDPGCHSEEVIFEESMDTGHVQGSSNSVDPHVMSHQSPDGEIDDASNAANASPMAKTRSSSGHTDGDLLANYDILPDLSFD